jgi:hypothetical protein
MDGKALQYKRQRATPPGSGSLACAVTGLLKWHGGYPPLQLQCRAGIPVQGPLRWRSLLPGSAFCRLFGTQSYSLLHHWHPSYSNQRAFLVILCFHRLMPGLLSRFCAFWKYPFLNLQKTITSSAGTVDSSGCFAPLQRCAGWECHTAGTAVRCAGRPGVPVEKSRGPRRHPRNRILKNHPAESPS